MKRSQVTIFIVIGILMLLMLGIFLVVDNRRHRFIPTKIIPQNILPVQRYIDTCMTDAAKSGLIFMGQQGGYIDIPRVIGGTRDSYIDIGSVQKIPLWWYRGENRMPTYLFMEEELEKYIERNMHICADGLKQFTEFNIENKTPKVDVTFGNDDVIVEMQFPITITDKVDNKVTKIIDFSTAIPVRYRRIFDVANQTYQHEMRTLFLEELHMNIMTSNPDFPFSGMDFGCSPKRWRVADVKSNLEKVIATNLPRVRIANTRYVPFLRPLPEYQEAKIKADLLRKRLSNADYDREDDPFRNAVRDLGLDDIPPDMYEYSNMFFDVGAFEPDMIVKLLFIPQYGMTLDVRPSEGGIMSSRNVKGMYEYLKFFCINVHHFAYDIKYPVEVRIVDDISLPDEGGYIFRFGVPVNIINNQGIKEDKGRMIFDTRSSSDDFCSILGPDDVEIEVRGIYEGYTDQPLEDVNLTYRCMRYYCDLGSTNARDGTYKYVGPVPANCQNPQILARKDGYVDSEGILSSESLTIYMDKLQEMDVEIKKRIYFKSTGLTASSYDIADDESVVLYISAQEVLHDEYLSYPFSPETPSTIGLVESGATYEINALLVKDSETIGGFYGENISIGYETIAGKSRMILTVVEYKPFPVTDEQKAEMMLYIYDGDYKDEVKVEFE